MKNPVLCLLVLLLVGCVNEETGPEPPAWQLVFQNDFDGNTLGGNVKDLISALKYGSPIRVSWGGMEADGSSWIEFAEPDFTTVMNDTAVVVQFPLSLIQTHYVDPKESFLKTDPPTGWRALMSTDGHYHQFHYNLKTGETTRIMYSRTNMNWYAIMPIPEHKPVPNLTPKNAFKLDSLIKM